MLRRHTPPLLSLSLLIAAVLALFTGAASEPALGQESDIDRDERVVFFPTAASYDAEARAWRVPVHAWVFEPELGSLQRWALLELVTGPLDDEIEESPMFQRRARLFLVDNERGQTVEIEIAGRRMTIGESGANGHVEATLWLPTRRLKVPPPGPRWPNPWLRFDLVTEADDERRFVGAYQLVAPAGLSVISDIDDTIKRSEVHDREALLRNTFLKEFEAIDGMSGLYRTLHERGAVFHYLSSSPWQLFELLERFLAREEFPAGSFHLKQIRLKDRSFWNLFASPEETKLPVLERILQRFPQRRFALFGDAVEKDPEVYAELARRHPEQVAGIFIRVPLPQFDDEARFAEAFANLPRERWTTFTDPAELRAEPLFRTLLNQDDARRWREPVQRSQP